MTQKTTRLGAGFLLGDVCALPNFGRVQSFYSLPCVHMILKKNEKNPKNPTNAKKHTTFYNISAVARTLISWCSWS